jgi:hypothetical protein
LKPPPVVCQSLENAYRIFAELQDLDALEAEALADGEITREVLRSNGFKHLEGEDAFFCKSLQANLASIESAGKSDG